MCHKPKWFSLLPGSGWLAVSAFVLLLPASLPAADVHLPSLKIGTDVFTNVTVYQVTASDIFVRHERGFGNAKISTLDDSALILLGLKSEKTEEEKTGGGNAAAVEKVKATLATMNLKLPSESSVLGTISRTKPTPQLLAGVLAGCLIGYLFYCYCLKRMCVNAGSNPGALVWLPIVQMFPLLQAARMPAWWFIIFFIPGLNLFAHVLWCVRITKFCGKGILIAIFLLLPLTNVLALLYLAFSSGNEAPAERTLKPEDLPGLAEA